MNAVTVAASLDLLDQLEVPANPFPGLRPFELHESHLFFGRDGQSARLIGLLAANRFVAVVGGSGSGKSSLVRAGLLPALLGGMMTQAGSDWRIALLRPGANPIANLAIALNECGLGGPGEAGPDMGRAVTEAVLRRGSLGLVEVVSQGGIAAGGNLLVVVDQFEELFRFARENRKSCGAADDAAAFVKLLLEARVSRPPEEGKPVAPNIFVVLTMRSDYLGDCAQFWGLPEAINQGQYLIPRLGRDQLRAAIEGPVAVGEGLISPVLVNRLLNDIGDNQDQLPILQHALMRTWDAWRKENRPGEPMDLRHYEGIGGMAAALSRHADEAYDSLPGERGRQIAESLFRSLTERGEDGRETRRPCDLGRFAVAPAAELAEVEAVVEVFRAPGRSFLMPPVETPLTRDTMIDISHESLIRVWERLGAWVRRESECARLYRRLAETAVLYAKGEAEPIGGVELQLVSNWREKNRPNKAWAERYAPGFDQAMEFLDASRRKSEADAREKEQRRQHELRLAKLWSRTMAALFGVAVVAAFLIYRYYDRAQAQERISRRYNYANNVGLAQKALDKGDLEQARELLKLVKPSPSDRSAGYTEDFAWRYLWTLAHPQSYRRLIGNEDTVNVVDFAPDGRTVATAGDDGSIRLFDVDTGQQSSLLQNKGDGEAGSVAYSPDGARLAAGVGNDVKVWDMGTRAAPLVLKGHTASVQSVAFSSELGRPWLASGSDDATIRFWQPPKLEPLFSLPNEQKSSIRILTFSRDGKMLAAGGDAASIYLWTLPDRQPRKPLAHEGTQRINDLDFSPTGNELAAAYENGSIVLWHNIWSANPTVSQVSGTRLAGAVEAVEYSRDGSLLASGHGDGAIRLWTALGSAAIAILPGHGGGVRSLSFSPDGHWLASASRDGSAGLWDLYTRNELALRGGKDVNYYALCTARHQLATVDSYGAVRLWDMERQGDPLELGKVENAYVAGMACDPNGRHLALLLSQGTLKVWELADRRELPIPANPGHSSETIAQRTDGSLVILDNEAKAMVWSGAGWEARGSAANHDQLLHLLALTPDGQWSAGATADRVIVRKVDTDKKLADFEAKVSALAFRPDGHLLASGNDDGEVKVWNVDEARPDTQAAMQHTGPVQCLAFSPDGLTLASLGLSGELKLWDTITWTELVQLDIGAGSNGGENGCPLNFSADGRVLALIHTGGKVRLLIGNSEPAEGQAPPQSAVETAGR